MARLVRSSFSFQLYSQRSFELQGVVHVFSFNYVKFNVDGCFGYVNFRLAKDGTRNVAEVIVAYMHEERILLHSKKEKRFVEQNV